MSDTKMTVLNFLQEYNSLSRTCIAFKMKHIDPLLREIIEAMGIKMHAPNILSINDDAFQSGIVVEYFSEWNKKSTVFIPYKILEASDYIAAAEKYRLEFNQKLLMDQLQKMERAVGALITDVAILKGTRKK
jgi:hypothetical protein